MRFSRRGLVVVLTVALASYALDCVGMSTPEQAMQCCKAMRCISHHHRQGEDCCKTMATTHVDIGQPTSAAGAFSPVALGLAGLFIESPTVTTSTRLISDQSHSPPISSPPDLLPLRI